MEILTKDQYIQLLKRAGWKLKKIQNEWSVLDPTGDIIYSDSDPHKYWPMHILPSRNSYEGVMEIREHLLRSNIQTYNLLKVFQETFFRIHQIEIETTEDLLCAYYYFFVKDGDYGKIPEDQVKVRPIPNHHHMVFRSYRKPFYGKFEILMDCRVIGEFQVDPRKGRDWKTVKKEVTVICDLWNDNLRRIRKV